MKTIIETYNNSSHRTLNHKSPNQVFKDNDDQMTRHLYGIVHNQQVYNSVPFYAKDTTPPKILNYQHRYHNSV